MFTSNVWRLGMVVLGCAVLIIGVAACTQNKAPTVVSTLPANSATDVPVNTKIVVTFSEAMDSETITLTQGTMPVEGTVIGEGITATFTPSDNLLPNTLYTATVLAGARSLSQLQKCGQSLDEKSGLMVLLTGIVDSGNKCARRTAQDFVWTFTTGTHIESEGETEGEGEGVDQEPVELGTTSTFAVLAGSTVESTGNSIITGDLGVSPGTEVVGFPPGVLNGELYMGAASAAGQAKLDLTDAFSDAAVRSTGSVSLPGNLSGLTLYPGLYTNSTSVMLSAGNVTLDAQGDANAVFIIQMGSTLTTESGTQVVLSSGAKAANIYWQVGSSATLGTTSIFKGNILAQESITLATGAALEGRALTQTAAVSLDSATITVPTP